MSKYLIILLAILSLVGCQQKADTEQSASPIPTETKAQEVSSGHLSLEPFTVKMQIQMDGAWSDSVVIKGDSSGRVDVQEQYSETPQFLQLSTDGILQMGGVSTKFELTPEGVLLENGKSSKYRFKTDDTLLYDETPHLTRAKDQVKDLASDDGLFMFQETLMKVTIEGETAATRPALFVLNSYMRASVIALEEDSPDYELDSAPATKDEATLESLTESLPKDEATLENIGDEFRN